MADQATVDQILATIRSRESGGNYTAKNGTSTASGAYQYINGTWKGWLGRLRPDLVSKYPTAMSAPSWLQDEVARANVVSILDSNGGRIDAVPRQWYTGNPNAPDASEPNAGLTVGRYVSGWMSAFNQTSGGNTPTGGVTAAMADDTIEGQSPEDYAKQTYGYLAAFLDHPEVGPILLQAATGHWSEDRLRGALSATQWWQNTNESARMFMAETEMDPAAQQSKINSRAAEIMARAQQLGYPLAMDRAKVVANDSVKFGWVGAELDRAIGNEVAGGNLLQSSFGRSFKQLTKSYAVPMSDGVVEAWARRVARGQASEEDFKNYLSDSAKSLYPQLSAAIDSGTTVEQFYDPYRQIAAQTLEIAPDAVDLSDPKWMAALSVTDQQGNRQPMRLDQWQQYLRTDPKYGWTQTKQANDQAEEFADRLGRIFGKVAS